VRREVDQRDLARTQCSRRRGRRDRQVARDGIVERDEPVTCHRRQQRGRERLRDRADLEDRPRPVGQLAAMPEAGLAARVQPDHEAGVTGGAAPEDLPHSLFDHRAEPRSDG
jgi:hypothetical protein